jgi:hypothetical protein
MDLLQILKFKAIFGLMKYNRAKRNRVEWNETKWNKSSIPLFGYFRKEINKIEGKWWYEIEFILSYYTQFNYYFSNTNNETLFYSISFRSVPSHSINQHSLSAYWCLYILSTKKFFMQVTFENSILRIGPIFIVII